MTLHAAIAYIKYVWTAKGRHKLHSPFVYNFTEQVLNNKAKHHTAADSLKDYAWMGHHYQKLLGRIIHYFALSEVLTAPPGSEDENGKVDVLILKDHVSRQWVSLFNKHLHLTHAGSIVMVKGIHHSQRHTKKWNRLVNHPRVRLSMDLYGVGLLFFNEDFKEKQSFVLRY
jgi:hypothetical protein